MEEHSCRGYARRISGDRASEMKKNPRIEERVLEGGGALLEGGGWASWVARAREGGAESARGREVGNRETTEYIIQCYPLLFHNRIQQQLSVHCFGEYLQMCAARFLHCRAI